MKKARITLKNYRCFSDEEPARFEIGPGFTAFLGPNNSGKSATKLMFYELRQLFAYLGESSLASGITEVFIPSWSRSVSYASVTDQTEIFHNQNDRPISIEIEIPDAETYPGQGGNDCLAKVIAECDRQQPQTWRFKTFRSGDPQKDLTLNNGRGKPSLPSPSVVALPDINLDCRDFVETCRVLGRASYYGPFRNVLNKGAGTHFDLVVGTSFSELWNDWKTAGNKAQARQIDRLSDSIKALFGFRKLEISPSRNLEGLIVAIDGHSYRLDELGSGIAQFIIVFGNAAITRPPLIMIDEPETNLHPALQKDFLISLASYADAGIVFSTHSVGLARSVANQIYSLQRTGDHSSIKEFEAIPNYLEFAGELSFSVFRDMGHDKVLLVEGIEDVLAIQQFLRLLQKDHRIVILPLGGRQMICKGRDREISELFRVSSNVAAVIDSERTAQDSELGPNQAAFEKTCRDAGVDICVTQRRAIENYFTERAVKAALGQAFTALKPYELLREHPNAWRKRDNWKIAGQMKKEEIADTDLGQFLTQL